MCKNNYLNDNIFIGSENMDQVKIGKFIASLRKEKNMTQEQFAQKMGVSINAVSK